MDRIFVFFCIDNNNEKAQGKTQNLDVFQRHFSCTFFCNKYLFFVLLRWRWKLLMIIDLHAQFIENNRFVVVYNIKWYAFYSTNEKKNNQWRSKTICRLNKEVEQFCSNFVLNIFESALKSVLNYNRFKVPVPSAKKNLSNHLNFYIFFVG